LIDGTVIFRKRYDNKSYVSILPREVAVVVEDAAPKAKKAAAPKAEVIEETVEVAAKPAAKKPAVKKEPAAKKAPAKKGASDDSAAEA